MPNPVYIYIDIYCCIPYIIDLPSSINTRQRSVRGPNQSLVFGAPLQLLSRTSVGWPCCRRHGSSRVWFGTRDPSSHREPPAKGLTLFGWARLIAWRLWRAFLGECRRGPRYFWEFRAHVSFGPAPGPTLKRPCAAFLWLMGREINTADQTPVFGAPLQFGRISAGRGVCVTDLDRCASALEIPLASGVLPLGFNPL